MFYLHPTSYILKMTSIHILFTCYILHLTDCNLEILRLCRISMVWGGLGSWVWGVTCPEPPWTSVSSSVPQLPCCYSSLCYFCYCVTVDCFTLDCVTLANVTLDSRLCYSRLSYCWGGWREATVCKAQLSPGDQSRADQRVVRRDGERWPRCTDTTN